MIKLLILLFLLINISGYAQNSAGEEVFNKLMNYCPKCHPIIWGSLSPEPRVLLVVPFKFWANLTTHEKFALAEYMFVFVKDVKNNPMKYFNEETKEICKTDPSAPICAIQESGGRNVKGWEIALGVYYKSNLFVNDPVICSKTIKGCHGLYFPDIKNIKKNNKTEEKLRLIFDKNFILEKREKWIRYYIKNGILDR